MKTITIKAPNIFGNPKYKGKYVAILGNKVVAYGSYEKVSKAADKIEKKTNQITAFTYVPKADVWIF